MAAGRSQIAGPSCPGCRATGTDQVAVARDGSTEALGKPGGSAARASLPPRPAWPRLSGRTWAVFILGLVFCLGLLIALGVPWSLALRATLGHLPQSSWTWQAVGQRGLTSITYLDFDLQVAGTGLFIPELKVMLGTNPPVGVLAVTGPTLEADLGWDRTLRFSGAVQMARLLPNGGIRGVVQGDGRVEWEDWSSPPRGGEADLHAPGLLVLAPGIMATNLRVQARLEGNRLILTSIRADGPISLEARGEVNLDWARPGESEYRLEGVLTGLGGMLFTVSGRLDGIWKGSP